MNDDEINTIIKYSEIIDKYNEDIDRESAYEILTGKIEEAAEEAHREEMEKQREKESKSRSRSRKKEKGAVEEMLNSSVGRTVVREVTRGLLGVLGIKSTRRRRSRKTGWF